MFENILHAAILTFGGTQAHQILSQSLMEGPLRDEEDKVRNGGKIHKQAMWYALLTVKSPFLS